MLNKSLFLEFEETLNNLEHSSKDARSFFSKIRALTIGCLLIATLLSIILSFIIGGGVSKLEFHYSTLFIIPWSLLICLGSKTIGPREYGIIYCSGKPIFAVGSGFILIIPGLFVFEKFSAEVFTVVGGILEAPTAYAKSAIDQNDVSKYSDTPFNNPMPIDIDYYFEARIDEPYGLCTMVSKFGSVEKALESIKIKINLILGDVVSVRTPAQIIGEKAKVDTEFNKKFNEIFGSNKKSQFYWGISVKNLKTFKPILDRDLLLKQKIIPNAFIDSERELFVSETAKKSMIIKAEGERDKRIIEAEAEKVWLDIQAHGTKVMLLSEAIGKKALAKAVGLPIIELDLRLKIMGEALKNSSYSSIIGSEGFSSLLGFWPILKDTVSRLSAGMEGKGGM